MTNDYVYVAHKSPHSNGSVDCAFRTFEDAQDFLRDTIDDEPDVDQYHVEEWRDQPRWTFVVDVGLGKVAGTIDKVPTAEGFDD